MRWRVKRSGVELERVVGREKIAAGSHHEVIRLVSSPEGAIIEGPLSEQFTKRYDDGEEFARSVVERLPDEEESAAAASADEDQGGGQEKQLAGEELEEAGRKADHPKLGDKPWSALNADEKRKALEGAANKE